ncbi:MAG: AraC family transcriptional regulator [Bacteroidales bacterium]|jgi:AraC-like DNA-binding protein/mannose-6-phosphate isomerase-like protein (cupin superfamily)|nr:AraC family transcriptional regulator [Bacteroidales bacterium]
MGKKENLHLVLLNTGHAEHNADWNWKGVNSPFARLYLVESGSAKVILPDGAFVLTPGHLYLIPAFTMHGYECDGIFNLYYTHIYEEQGIFEQLIIPFEVEACPVDTLLVKRLLEINPGRELKRYDPDSYDNPPTFLRDIAKNAQQPLYSTVETNGILQQLFSRFLVQARSKPETADQRIVKTLRYIRENIDRLIGIRELSSLCFLTDDHYIRLFKKEMNCTPIRYINRKKIEKAQLLLIIDSQPIKDIAYRLSFDNISYFNRLFKRVTGVTPMQYRKASSPGPLS